MKDKLELIKKEIYDEGAVGWGAWVIVFVLCIYPGIQFILYFTHDTIPYAGRVATGIFFGAIFAGFITWAINDICFRLIVRPKMVAEEAARRKEKKKAKRK